MNQISVSPQYFTYNNNNFIYYSSTFDVWVYQDDQEPPFYYRNFTVQNENDALQFAYFIESIPIGTITCIAIDGNKVSYISDTIYKACESIGSIKIYEITGQVSNRLAIIGFKGLSPGVASEAYINSTQSVSSELPSHFDYKILSVSIDSTPTLSIGTNKVNFQYGIGMNVITFNEVTLEVMSSINFNTVTNTTQANLDFIQFISNRPTNVVTCIIPKCPTPTSTGQSLMLSSGSIDAIKSIGSIFIDQFTNATLGQSKWFLISKSRLNQSELSSKSSAVCQGIYFAYNNDANMVGCTISACNPLYGSTNFFQAVNGSQIVTPTQFNGFSMSILDEYTGKVLSNNQIIASGTPGTNQMSMKTASDYILQNITAGNFVMISSSNLQTPFSIPDYLITAFRTLGANLSNRITSSSSYALFGRKGAAPGSSPEIHSNNGPVTISAKFASKLMIMRTFVEIKAVSRGIGENVPYETTYAKFFLNGEEVKYTASRGLNVMIINQDNGLIESITTYDTHGDANASSQFITLMNSLANGRIVAIATMDDWTVRLSTEAINTLKTKCGGQILGVYPLQYRASCSFIGIVGKSIYPSQLVSSGNTLVPLPVINTFRLPIKVTLGDGFNYQSITVNSAQGINVNNTSVGTVVDGVKIATFSLPFTKTKFQHDLELIEKEKQQEIIEQVSAPGDQLYQLISNLTYGSLVALIIPSNMVLNDKIKRSLYMIGASQMDLASQNSFTNYLVIGRKGACSGALESFSSSLSITSISSVEPISNNTSLASWWSIVATIVTGSLLVVGAIATLPLSTAIFVGVGTMAVTTLVVGGIIMNEMPDTNNNNTSDPTRTYRNIVIGVSYIGTANERPEYARNSTDFLQTLVNTVDNYWDAENSMNNIITRKNDTLLIDNIPNAIPNASAPPSSVPTRNNILNELRNTVARTRGGDVISLTISGHGGYRNGEYRLRVTRLGNTGPRRITGTEIIDALNALTVTNVMVYFLITTCHSGAFMAQLAARTNLNFAYVIIVACPADRTTRSGNIRRVLTDNNRVISSNYYMTINSIFGAMTRHYTNATTNARGPPDTNAPGNTLNRPWLFSPYSPQLIEFLLKVARFEVSPLSKCILSSKCLHLENGDDSTCQSCKCHHAPLHSECSLVYHNQNISFEYI
ncbi:hypothetical protein PPL_04619 [Heterostelium album PN500]|uniref:ILEI/PANDER domain-containing protein n=1 Tax=Heterostelium pallidum (strain ATCC 26659 / Pp 5 / PN500) TaxID=670386 RepID=D3B829_HETP5|nr:hypothetical protein PPL_04619 [Heterostelium album PN500]EFA82197.1 hypothetical protein PPL_04619 [Heterostelium album PN500]|eukprot:XP_020434314.1 hypothetical protein PPL_04619 [Heterostelium album PN500]